MNQRRLEHLKRVEAREGQSGLRGKFQEALRRVKEISDSKVLGGISTVLGSAGNILAGKGKGPRGASRVSIVLGVDDASMEEGKDVVGDGGSGATSQHALEGDEIGEEVRCGAVLL